MLVLLKDRFVGKVSSIEGREPELEALSLLGDAKGIRCLE